MILREDGLDQDTDVTLFIAGGHHDTDADRLLGSDRVFIGPVSIVALGLDRTHERAHPKQRQRPQTKPNKPNHGFFPAFRTMFHSLSSMASIGSLSCPSGAPSPTRRARYRA